MPNWEKRSRNRAESKKILNEHGLYFTEHNGGVHLKVHYKGKIIDFWPGTGLFRGDGIYGRGVQNLVDLVKDESPEASMRIYTIDQLFEIAKNSKDKSLYGICTSIHEAVYQ